MNAEKFYRSPKWINTKNSRIKDDKYTCLVCREHYDETSKFIVDHIIPRKLLQDENQWCDKTNLWTLCKCCNSVKQRLEHVFNDEQLETITKDQWIKLIRNSKDYCRANCEH